MMFCKTTCDLIIPCVLLLITVRSEYLYSPVQNEIIILLKNKWYPKCVIVDFEMSLFINSSLVIAI
ncbi:hypothetical protein MXB_958 [Myxobolus squamalis]|nr:hypothetical protein MXB_958 [Myxobolus squamalis]